MKVLKNELKIEEEEFLNNLYDSVKCSEIQTAFEIYVKNIQLVFPQSVNAKKVYTDKDIEIFYKLDKFVHKQIAYSLGKGINVENDIIVLFEHNYGRFRAFQFAMWFNDELLRKQYAKGRKVLKATPWY